MDKWSGFEASVVVFAGATVMPHKRPVKKGSFGAHFDELVKHFPHPARQVRPAPSTHEPAGANLKERLDIHALLFERAWRLEQEQDRGS